MSMIPQGSIEFLFEKLGRKTIFNAQEIAERLPHSYPFLMVDRIVEIGQRFIVGMKNVTQNEWFFQGHFKEEPIMPGVLILEGMAQTGGILAYERIPNATIRGNYLLKIQEAKFKGMVTPGDILFYYVELGEELRRGLYFLRGETYVENKKVAEAEITLFNKNLQSTSIKIF